MPIRTKRWNDPVEPEDGFRLLVTRYRPRGVAREGEPWAAWCPELAPSVELHAAAYGKDGQAPIPFGDYEARFREEMKPRGYWLLGFAEMAKRGETLTLLCSSACVDPARCHRTIVKAMLEDLVNPPPPVATSRVVRRRREG